MSLPFPLSFLPLSLKTHITDQNPHHRSNIQTDIIDQPSKPTSLIKHSNPHHRSKPTSPPKQKNNENLIHVLFFNPQDTSPPLCLFRLGHKIHSTLRILRALTHQVKLILVTRQLNSKSLSWTQDQDKAPFVMICLCVCVCVWVCLCLCLSEEKDDED